MVVRLLHPSSLGGSADARAPNHSRPPKGRSERDDELQEGPRRGKFWDGRVGTGYMRVREEGGEGEREEQDGYGYGLGEN